jgi:hypothetical protein
MQAIDLFKVIKDLQSKRGYEDSSDGIYMIFEAKDDVFMGKVLSISDIGVCFHPWNFLHGGLDLDQERILLFVDINKSHTFDDIHDMDSYHAKHYWNKETLNDTK